MYKLFFYLFLRHWHVVPGWIRYSISGLVVAAGVVLWIMVPEGWPAYVLLMLVGIFMMLYGEPSEAEKKGYHF